MANPLTYGQEQAERNLSYWQGMSGSMRRPSPLASPEERRAYTAQQVRAGRAPEYMLSESYGGMPTGSTRRAIRARDQWEAQQAQIAAYNEAFFAQQKAIDDAYKMQFEQKEKLRESRRQDAELSLKMQEYEDKSDRDDRVKKDAIGLMASLRGYTRPDGVQIAPINPQDPDAISRLEDVASINKYAFESPAAKAVWDRRYNDALSFAKQNAELNQKQIEQQRSWLIGQQEEAASLGVDTGKYFITKQDPQTNETVVSEVDQLGLSKAIGEAKRKDLETKTQAALSSDIAKENKTAVKGIADEIYKIGSQIRENDSLVVGARNAVERNEYIRKANYLRGEDAILRKRLNELVPQPTQQPAITKFNSAQEAEAANLPKGTIVEIGGRKARID